MRRWTAGRTISTAVLSAAAFVAAAAVGAGSNDSPRQVLHLLVRVDAEDEPVRTLEYWLDEQRSLARAEEQTASGKTVNASGMDWFLHIPSEGAALYYETIAGAGPTRSVFASLFYMRDAHRAGAAVTVSDHAETIVVRLGERIAALERRAGLPRWESAPGLRVDYHYQVVEDLPADAFPESFFANRGSRVTAATIETSTQAAATRVSFRMLSAGDVLLGRRLEKTLVSFGANALTLEQVTQVYGDVTVTISLLTMEPPDVRPGGVSVLTALGAGRVYAEPDRVHLMILNGRIAVNVFGPDASTALATVDLLQPVR